MRPEQIKAEIDRLDFSEKLRLVEEVWDSIAASNEEIPLSDWQKQELERRYRDFKEGKVELHDSAAVHEALRARYK